METWLRTIVRAFLACIVSLPRREFLLNHGTLFLTSLLETHLRDH